MGKPIETWEQLKDAAEREALVLVCGIGDENKIYSVGRCVGTGHDKVVGIRNAFGTSYLGHQCRVAGNVWGGSVKFTLTEMDHA